MHISTNAGLSKNSKGEEKRKKEAREREEFAITRLFFEGG